MSQAATQPTHPHTGFASGFYYHRQNIAYSSTFFVIHHAEVFGAQLNSIGRMVGVHVHPQAFGAKSSCVRRIDLKSIYIAVAVLNVLPTAVAGILHHTDPAQIPQYSTHRLRCAFLVYICCLPGIDQTARTAG